MDGETRRETGRESRAFVGARLREFRERCGMGTGTLSAISDIPETTIASMEAGRSPVTLEDMLRLSRALGVRVTELFDQEGGNEPGGAGAG